MVVYAEDHLHIGLHTHRYVHLKILQLAIRTVLCHVLLHTYLHLIIQHNYFSPIFSFVTDHEWEVPESDFIGVYKYSISVSTQGVYCFLYSS